MRVCIPTNLRRLLPGIVAHTLAAWLALPSLSCIAQASGGVEPQQLEASTTVSPTAQPPREDFRAMSPFWRENTLKRDLLRERWDQVIENSRIWLELEPDNPLALSALGEALRQTGQYEASVQAYQAALKRKPEAVEYLLGLGRTYRAMKDFEQAEKVLLEANKLDPKNNDVLAELGFMAVDAKDYLGATHYFVDFDNNLPGVDHPIPAIMIGYTAFKTPYPGKNNPDQKYWMDFSKKKIGKNQQAAACLAALKKGASYRDPVCVEGFKLPPGQKCERLPPPGSPDGKAPLPDPSGAPAATP